MQFKNFILRDYNIKSEKYFKISEPNDKLLWRSIYRFYNLPVTYGTVYTKLFNLDFSLY